MVTEVTQLTAWQTVRQSHAIHPDWNAEMHRAYLEHEAFFEGDGLPPLEVVERWLHEMTRLPPLSDSGATGEDGPVSAPPHFIAPCQVCERRMQTSRESLYRGDKPWTYRCGEHRVSRTEAAQ